MTITFALSSLGNHSLSYKLLSCVLNLNNTARHCSNLSTKYTTSFRLYCGSEQARYCMRSHLSLATGQTLLIFSFAGSNEN